MTTSARVVVAPPYGLPQVRDVALPNPTATQVLIRQHASGICHSQLHTLHRPRTSPVLLGHESTGVVVARGSDVTHVELGDTVLVTWVPRNPAAATNWRGGYVLDLGDGSTASTSDVFTWATHTIADESLVVKAPIGTAHDVTSIIGCAVMTGAGAVMNSAMVKAGQSVAIFGVGGVGLSAVVAAKELGANPIIAVDLDDVKLDFARRFGATHSVNGKNGDAVEQVRALTDGAYEGLGFRGLPINGVDFAFDCIGHRSTMEQILAVARPGRFGVERGGTAVLVGVPTTPMDLNVTELLMTEKSYIGSIGGSCKPDRDFPMFVQWHADGRLPLDEMVTERFALDDVNVACDALASGKISGRAIFDLR
jgi:Zn-dependent alcohol dehydrogenase